MVKVIDHKVGSSGDTVVKDVPEPPKPRQIDPAEVYPRQVERNGYNDAVRPEPIQSSVPPASAPEAVRRESSPGFRNTAMDKITTLKDDFLTLYRQEIALAKAEVREGAGKVKASAGSIGIGIAFAIGGFGLLLGAATQAVTWLCMALGLGLMPSLVIGFVSIGLLSLLVGYAAIKAGQKKIENSNLRVPKTKETLRRSKELMEEQKAA